MGSTLDPEKVTRGREKGRGSDAQQSKGVGRQRWKGREGTKEAVEGTNTAMHRAALCVPPCPLSLSLLGRETTRPGRKTAHASRTVRLGVFPALPLLSCAGRGGKKKSTSAHTSVSPGRNCSAEQTAVHSTALLVIPVSFFVRSKRSMVRSTFLLDSAWSFEDKVADEDAGSLVSSVVL